MLVLSFVTKKEYDISEKPGKSQQNGIRDHAQDLITLSVKFQIKII
jgi:hypothetical protein